MNCDLGMCTPHCLGVTLSCTAGLTQCGTWNFESNSAEGWQTDTSQLGTATNFQIKTAPGGSLALSFNLSANPAHDMTFIRVPLCPGQTAAAKNHWITAQVYAEGPPLTGQSTMENAVTFYWTDSFNNVLGGTQYFLLFPGNIWVTVGDSTFANIDSDGVAFLYLGLYVDRTWSGTIYIDNIQLH